MRTAVNTEPATPESVWALLRELTLKQAETDQLIKETSLQQKETDRLIQETGLQQKETDRLMQEIGLQVKKVNETLGSWAKNQGSFAEDYFFNSFEQGKRNFFGEKFDEIAKNLTHFWQGLKDEYDIVLYNHDSVALIEVKYKAHVSDIPDVLKKAETFRILFPNYKDFKIYLGLASMSFYPALEEKCIDNGIAIIKQVGDTVVINDKHLKVY